MALWTPAEITTALWLDSDDASTITIATGVSQWRDKSGNDRHVSQGTTTAQPGVVTAELNGKQIIRFDGTTDSLVNAAGILANTAFTVFAVSKLRTALTDKKWICGEWNSGSGAGTNEWLLAHGNGSTNRPTIFIESGSTTYSAAATSDSLNVWGIHCGVHNLSSLQHFLNDVIDATTTAAVTKNSVSGRQFIVGAIAAGFPSPVDISEVIVLSSAADIATRQIIFGYLAWKWGLAANLAADHPYKSAAPTIPDPISVLNVFLSQPYTILSAYLNITCEQLYGIASDLGVSCFQLYSMVMEVWLTQLYGDLQPINKSLIQPYRSAPVLNKVLDQRWADALQIERSLLQEWSMPGPLEASSEQRYGICAEVLELTCEQLYNINERTTLFAGLIQPYALAGEAARLYQFNIKLYLDGLRIPYHSLEWQAVDSEAFWSCDFAVKSQAVALRCVDGAAITIVSPWDTWQLKVSGGWSEDKRHGSTLYRVRGYSRTKGLDQALPLLGDLPAGMASQLVADLAAPFGISVDWQMADGYLAAGKVTANDQTPMAVIKEIVHDARGIVLSTLDGNLLIVTEEEIPIPDYPTVTPADTIIARLERISTSSQPDEQRGYNRFKVSDQLASGDGFRWDTVLIDARTKEARLFVVPFDPTRRFALTHSGGSNVSIEPFGLRSLQVPAEQVEFVAGSSKTRLPIYGDVSYAWKQANLGAVSYAEDGLLTAATPGESLLSISYRTQYYRWIVRDPHVEDVQIIFNEVPA